MHYARFRPQRNPLANPVPHDIDWIPASTGLFYSTTLRIPKNNHRRLHFFNGYCDILSQKGTSIRTRTPSSSPRTLPFISRSRQKIYHVHIPKHFNRIKFTIPKPHGTSGLEGNCLGGSNMSKQNGKPTDLDPGPQASGPNMNSNSAARMHTLHVPTREYSGDLRHVAVAAMWNRMRCHFRGGQ